jgi:hypothetical protein
LVITNPPYLGAGQHGPVLKDFCEEHFNTAKGDLANVFLERSLKLCASGGAVSFVMPQNWLFLKSYQKQREHLLKYETWNLLVRLGSGAFETITGEVVNAILLTLTHSVSAAKQKLHGLDVSAPRTLALRSACRKGRRRLSVSTGRLKREGTTQPFSVRSIRTVFSFAVISSTRKSAKSSGGTKL